MCIHSVMTTTQSGTFVAVISLAAVLFAFSFVGCSFETSEFSGSDFTKRTFVRAHSSARTAKAAETDQRDIYSGVGPRLMATAVHASSPITPVVQVPRRNDFKRYAVAYSKPYAVVHDQSIIPFALRSKQRPLKRFELPFFKRKRQTAANEEKPPQLVEEEKPKIRVRTTAYTHSERDHLKYGRRSALGTRLRFGSVRSAAADWSRYPVGTQFRIAGQPGIVYEVDDYGGALVGTGTIDLYKPTFSAMNRWGVRHVDIEVIQWGSFARSLKVLKPRTKWSHVRRMVQSIRKKGATEEARLAAVIMPHRAINATDQTTW